MYLYCTRSNKVFVFVFDDIAELCHNGFETFMATYSVVPVAENAKSWVAKWTTPGWWLGCLSQFCSLQNKCRIVDPDQQNWFGPPSFSSLSYINCGKIVLRSDKFQIYQILFWRLVLRGLSINNLLRRWTLKNNWYYCPLFAYSSSKSLWYKLIMASHKQGCSQRASGRCCTSREQCFKLKFLLSCPEMFGKFPY